MQIVGERYTAAKSFSCQGNGGMIKLIDKQLDNLNLTKEMYSEQQRHYKIFLRSGCLRKPA